MSANYSLKRDLQELLEMSGKLGEYLLGDALYMPVGGGFFRGSTTPQLTIGSFLLRRRRLSQLRGEMNPAQLAKLDSVLARHDALQREWRLHYEKKLNREVPSRLKVMVAFFRECGESPRDCASAYPVEAMRRTIVQEILLAMDVFNYDASNLAAGAQRTDLALRRLLHSGAFVWSSQLEAIYPRNVFWWLYGRPAAD